MKRIKWFWKNFRKKYITQPTYCTPSVQAAADANVLRSSVSRYFKEAAPGFWYEIDYDPLYDNAIDSLRADGWQVQLQADASGELFYAVHLHPSLNTQPRF